MHFRSVLALNTWFKFDISLGEVEFSSSCSLEKEFSKVEYVVPLISDWKGF